MQLLVLVAASRQGPTISSDALKDLHLANINLNVIHFNAQSIVPSRTSSKIDEIRLVFSNNVFDVICISETWLKDHIGNEAVALDGYNLHRMDRVASRGGGVCAYIRKSLKARVVGSLTDDCIAEGIFIEIESVGGIKVLLGIVYLPHGGFTNCEGVLQEISARYLHTIIVGDFNVDLFGREIEIARFSSSCGLEVVHNAMPTHIVPNTGGVSLIDYFLVTDRNLVESSGQFLFPSLNSHHAAIYASIAVRKRIIPVAKQIRDYSRLDTTRCFEDLSNSNLDYIFTVNDPNSQLEVFNDVVQDVYDRHVPLKFVRNRGTSNWYEDPLITTALNMRDLAYRAFVENRNDLNWKIYYLWNELRKVGFVDSSRVVTNINVDECNRSFILPPVNDQQDLAIRRNLAIDENAFSLRNVDVHEVWDTIGRYLVHIFNTILTTSTFPRIWTRARVVPVPKIRSPQLISDYRPISIVPALSKALESLINEQMTSYLNETRLLSVYQSGFRKGCSTTTLMTDLVDGIRELIDGRNVVALVSLDFSRAFDSISHIVLLNKLYEKFHFSSSTCFLLKSFLSHRTQFVQCGDDVSDVCEVYRGVPQGSILGPLLFSLYINDLQLIAHSSGEDLQHFEAKVNRELGSISDWCRSNYIDINIAKSKSMIFDCSFVSYIHFALNGCTLQNVKFMKVLGFYVDDKLKFDVHVFRIASRLAYLLRRLYATGVSLPLEVKKVVGKSLLLPHILYGIEVYSGAPLGTLDRLRILFNRIVRYVYVSGV
ncbi:uncharacterized protein LOC142227324 [Haematobia irritans]|uniref:uncharacterized protein LOC142227324 n=1 Tax=Haematobia irritans TaxID=7368 RepID=UPI003F4FABC4